MKKESEVKTKDKLIVLYDESGSMKKSGRVIEARQIFNSSKLESNIKNVEIQTFGTSHTSDLHGALSSIIDADNEDIGAVLLFSDLRQTGVGEVEGIARKFGQNFIPVFPVNQSVSDQRDVGLSRVALPKIVYNDEAIAVSIQIKLENMKGETVPLRLYFNGEEIERVNAYASRKFEKSTHYFSLQQKEGEIRIELDAPQGDVVFDNNMWRGYVSRTVDVRNVLLIGSEESRDFHEFKATFGRDDSAFNLTTKNRVSGRDIDWQNYDKVVLFGPQLDEGTWRSLRAAVQDGIDLVIVADRGIRYNSLSRNAFIPVSPGLDDTAPFSIDVENSQLKYDGETPLLDWRRKAAFIQADAEEKIRIVEVKPRKEFETVNTVEDSLKNIALAKSSATEYGVVFSREEGKGLVSYILTDELWKLAAIENGHLYKDFWWTILDDENQRIGVHSWEEWNQLDADSALQERVASLSYGKLLDAETLDTLPATLMSQSRSVSAETRFSIWNTWTVFTLATMVLSVDWYLRKKERLS